LTHRRRQLLPVRLRPAVRRHACIEKKSREREGEEEEAKWLTPLATAHPRSIPKHGRCIYINTYIYIYTTHAWGCTRHRANLKPLLRNPTGVHQTSGRTIPAGRLPPPSTAPSSSPTADCHHHYYAHRPSSACSCNTWTWLLPPSIDDPSPPRLLCCCCCCCCPGQARAWSPPPSIPSSKL
jgi:hypothetical protein